MPAAQPGPAPALFLQVLTQVSPKLSLGAQSGAADAACRDSEAAEASPGSCSSQLGDYSVLSNSRGSSWQPPAVTLVETLNSCQGRGGSPESEGFSASLVCSCLSRASASCSSSSIPSTCGKNCSVPKHQKERVPARHSAHAKPKN